MNRMKQIALLIVIAVTSAGVTALLHQPWALGESVPFMFTALATTFLMALLTTTCSEIRYDFIAIAVGLPSALACGINLFSVIFIIVPFIGAAIGRDLRKRIKTEKRPTKP